ncbi:MAG TPA: amidohydrolase family protein, partial [Longimicrobiales bacterium]
MTTGLLLCAAPLAAQAPTHNPPAGVLVLRNVTLIDGTGRPAQPNRTIIIRDGRIAEIATAQSAPPRGSQVLDLSGHFVIPGLVDAHVHLTSPFALRTQQDSLLTFLFKSGITSVRDMAGDAVVLKEHARLAADSQLPVPRVYYSALMAGAEFLRTEPRARAIAQGGTPGELAWLRALTDTTNMKDVIAAAKDIGVTGIKLYADLPVALVERVTAEAHRQGLKVWAHATLAPAKPTEVIDAGVDVISHLDMLVFEGE